MINPFNKTPAESKEIEWLSLDDYVQMQGNKTIYARVRGENFNGIQAGDSIVADCERKPTAADIVLILAGDTYTFKNFSDVQGEKNPLRLIARNGQAVKTETRIRNNIVPIEIIGVVAHVLKTFGGTK